MTRARRELVDLESTPYYHCISRCVRRAFLCGEDRLSGRSYDHRKQWILDRLKTLASVFAIDVCAYALMSNHYHVVLYLDRERAAGWSLDEVIDRWYQLFRGQLLVDRYRAGKPLTGAESQAVRKLAETWRARLVDLGWFMRCLNEPIARQANAEDSCKGRFWEGRYTSQALLDEQALLACMSYVDLNPVRAGLAETAEEAGFTSIHERIRALGPNGGPSQAQANANPGGLRGFAGEQAEPASEGIPFPLMDYLALVDWTGRAIRQDNKASVPAHLAPIFDRLAIDPDQWPSQIEHYGQRYRRAVGTLDRMSAFAARLGRRWLWGIAAQNRRPGPQPI
ncbi:MAG: transposase [Gammaproteobacteria bacterium]|nr:transposase [Gammaproteobacteria bacterium]NIR97509.1 transposase [Gammaproteobacteria bacterium]NIT63147.1 transposase [Gammaproteobacteria bacterium]NIV19266.1 transposase [Gammaproteobacteria bacterium]NIX10256.1 transposase [Gammaproteobacteria bacterium]